MDQTAGKSSQENPAQKDLAAPQPYSGLSTGSLSCARALQPSAPSPPSCLDICTYAHTYIKPRHHPNKPNCAATCTRSPSESHPASKALPVNCQQLTVIILITEAATGMRLVAMCSEQAVTMKMKATQGNTKLKNLTSSRGYHLTSAISNSWHQQMPSQGPTQASQSTSLLNPTCVSFTIDESAQARWRLAP